jgi:hypothetical protein
MDRKLRGIEVLPETEAVERLELEGAEIHAIEERVREAAEKQSDGCYRDRVHSQRKRIQCHAASLPLRA